MTAIIGLPENQKYYDMKYSTRIDYREMLRYDRKYNENPHKMKEHDYQLLEMLWRFADSGNAKKVIEGKTNFYWFQFKLIKIQFPTWKVGRTTCFNRIKRLVDLGLLTRHPEGKKHQGYYAFTKRIDDFPNITKRRTSAQVSENFFESQYEENTKKVRTLNIEVTSLKKQISKLAGVIQSKDNQIKDLYKIIEQQKQLIHSQERTKKDPPNVVTNDAYQLCLQVYKTKHAEYYKQVHSVSNSIDTLTLPEEKQLRKLVYTAKGDIRKINPLVEDNPRALAEEFGYMLDAYISLASQGKKVLWFGDTFTPSNLYRHYSDFINKANILIKKGQNGLSKFNQSGERGAEETELERRLEELRG